VQCVATSDGTASVTNTKGYAIVTTEEIALASEELRAFMCHKASRGFRTHLFTESEWNAAGVSGDAAADLLRQFLQTAAASYSLDFLLLVGDPRPFEGPLPMKVLYPRSQPCNNLPQVAVPSDYYYSVLNGSWDLNGNGQFGEYGENGLGDFGSGGVDPTQWELAVGRIPVYSTDPDKITRLDQVLRKTMAYEAAQESDTSWRRSGLVAAEGEIRVWFGEAMASMYASQPGYLGTYRVYDAANCWPQPPSDPCGQNLPYVNGTPLTDQPDALTCSVANVKDGWLSHTPGLVSWLTHGGWNGAAGVMDNAAANALKESTPAIVFHGSCWTGNPYDDNNLAWVMLRKGAVGAVAATQVSHGPGQMTDPFPAEKWFGSNAGMAHAFMGEVQDNIPIGVALAQIKENTLYENCYYWQNYAAYALYGDPSVKIDASDAHEVLAGERVMPECHGPSCPPVGTCKSKWGGPLSYAMQYCQNNCNSLAACTHRHIWEKCRDKCKTSCTCAATPATQCISISGGPQSYWMGFCQNKCSSLTACKHRHIWDKCREKCHTGCTCAATPASQCVSISGGPQSYWMGFCQDKCSSLDTCQPTHIRQKCIQKCQSPCACADPIRRLEAANLSTPDIIV
jgi:hypothetical protein